MSTYKNPQTYLVRSWKNNAYDTDVAVARDIMFPEEGLGLKQKAETLADKFSLDLSMATSIIEFNNLVVMLDAFREINLEAKTPGDVVSMTGLTDKKPHKIERMRFRNQCAISLEKFKIVVATIALQASTEQIRLISKELGIPSRTWASYRMLLAKNVDRYYDEQLLRGKLDVHRRSFTRAGKAKVAPISKLILKTKMDSITTIVEKSFETSNFPFSSSLLQFAVDNRLYLHHLPLQVGTEIEQKLADMAKGGEIMSDENIQQYNVSNGPASVDNGQSQSLDLAQMEQDAYSMSPERTVERTDNQKGRNSLVPIMRESQPRVPTHTAKFFTRAGAELAKTKQQGEDVQGLVVGLAYFDTKIGKIRKAVKNDDPFADQHLLNLEKRIADVMNLVVQQTRDLKQQIEHILKQYNMTITFHEKSHCMEMEIPYLHTQHAVLLSYLLHHVDTYLFTLYLAKRQAVISEQMEESCRRDTQKLFRSLIYSVAHWKNTGITRTALAQDTEATLKAYQANLQVGLTTEVLTMEVRSQHSPTPQNHRGNVIRDSVLLQRLTEHDVQAHLARAAESGSAKNSPNIIKKRRRSHQS